MIPWQSVRKRLSCWERRLIWSWNRLRYPRHSFLHFRCNICAKETCFPRDQMEREVCSCMHCGSTVRWRSVIHALSMELFGESLVLPDFPTRPDLIGVGLTDWDGYAISLAKKLTYTNTYYHKAPFLDITSVDPSQYGLYDFIISSDVFEHISPPISKSFENACRLLKPGGFMIFSVPYVEGATKEHFPELYRFSIERRRNDNWVVMNHTSDGRVQEFSGVTFHGGPGTVLEMRLFGKDDLLRSFADAGFVSAKPYNEECPEYGILWLPYIAENARYRPLIYGLDTPPWALQTRPADTE